MPASLLPPRRSEPLPEPSFEDIVALGEPSAPPALRGEAILRQLENLWLRLDRLVEHALPPALNPLTQFGAIANMCLLIAVLSGVALLIWYTPSVHQAYDSLEKIRASSFLGQLTRSVHRYSADGCICFVLLHALRIFCQGRIAGARWLAWCTGAGMLALLSFVGWTGYWLVWDVRAQHEALGAARMLDLLPIFAEPLSRSFLTNESVPSLLFFLVFFVHMLAPLALGVGVWMHLMRVNRAKFLTSKAMALWILGSLILISIAAPAWSAAPADMTVKASRFTMDWWYLWSVALTDRFGAGALWGGLFAVGLAAFTVPWWMVKKKRTSDWKAEVELARCVGCSLCAKDCPFNAITMIPREDGRKFDLQSQVNPALCVGCGICTGACDSQSINLPAVSSRAVEQQVQSWITSQKAAGEKPFIAFCCAQSAGALFSVKEAQPRLKGWLIQSVPCSGWVSANLMERALQKGAEGILVIGCGNTDPIHREGMAWFEGRLTGRHEPWFDSKKADPGGVRFLKLDRTRPEDFLKAAEAFRAATDVPSPVSNRIRRLATAGAMVLAASLGIYALSDAVYRSPAGAHPELVVSFNHSGALLEARKLSAEELAKRLPHMRAQVNVTRQKAPVGLRVTIDGRKVVEKSYAPKGLSKDGPSIALERLSTTAGKHEIQVDIADDQSLTNWTKHWSGSLEFEPSRVRVILFDTKNGFSAR